MIGRTALTCPFMRLSWCVSFLEIHIGLILQESRRTPCRRAASPHSPPPSPTTSSLPRHSSSPLLPPPPSRDSGELACVHTCAINVEPNWRLGRTNGIATGKGKKCSWSDDFEERTKGSDRVISSLFPLLQRPIIVVLQIPA